MESYPCNITEQLTGKELIGLNTFSCSLACVQAMFGIRASYSRSPSKHRERGRLAKRGPAGSCGIAGPAAPSRGRSPPPGRTAGRQIQFRGHKNLSTGGHRLGLADQIFPFTASFQDRAEYINAIDDNTSSL